MSGSRVTSSEHDRPSAFIRATAKNVAVKCLRVVTQQLPLSGLVYYRMFAFDCYFMRVALVIDSNYKTSNFAAFVN